MARLTRLLALTRLTWLMRPQDNPGSTPQVEYAGSEGIVYCDCNGVIYCGA